MPALGQRVVQLEGQMQEHAGAIGDLRRATDGLQVETRDLRSEVRDLRAEMNRRFEHMDQKIDRHFTWLVGMLVALLLGLVGLSLQISRLQPL